MEEQYYDEWLDEEPVSIKNQQSPSDQSLFHRRVILFGNEVIEKNIDLMMQKPILNQQFDQKQDQEEAEEAPEWMKAEKTENTVGQSNLEEQKESQMTKGEKINSRVEALFDPLQDEQNEKWTRKHCKQSQRPLTCPSCFNQLTYNYSIGEEEGLFCTNEVFGAQAKENKVIRQQSISEKMIWNDFEIEEAQKALKEREQAFNVKFLLECECGLAVGYFDINRYCYVLTNVI